MPGEMSPGLVHPVSDLARCLRTPRTTQNPGAHLQAQRQLLYLRPAGWHLPGQSQVCRVSWRLCAICGVRVQSLPCGVQAPGAQGPWLHPGSPAKRSHTANSRTAKEGFAEPSPRNSRAAGRDLMAHVGQGCSKDALGQGAGQVGVHVWVLGGSCLLQGPLHLHAHQPMDIGDQIPFSACLSSPCPRLDGSPCALS